MLCSSTTCSLRLPNTASIFKEGVGSGADCPSVCSGESQNGKVIASFLLFFFMLIYCFTLQTGRWRQCVFKLDASQQWPMPTSSDGLVIWNCGRCRSPCPPFGPADQSERGGAEEKREKSKRALLADGEKCYKLTDLFLKSSAASASTSTYTASTNVSNTAEPAHQGERQDSEEY